MCYTAKSGYYTAKCVVLYRKISVVPPPAISCIYLIPQNQRVTPQTRRVTQSKNSEWGGQTQNSLTWLGVGVPNSAPPPTGDGSFMRPPTERLGVSPRTAVVEERTGADGGGGGAMPKPDPEKTCWMTKQEGVPKMGMI